MSGYTKEALVALLEKKRENRFERVEEATAERTDFLAKSDGAIMTFVDKIMSAAGSILEHGDAYKREQTEENWTPLTRAFRDIHRLYEPSASVREYDRKLTEAQRVLDELDTFIEMVRSSSYDTFSQSQLKDLGLLSEIRRGIHW